MNATSALIALGNPGTSNAATPPVPPSQPSASPTRAPLPHQHIPDASNSMGPPHPSAMFPIPLHASMGMVHPHVPVAQQPWPAAAGFLTDEQSGVGVSVAAQQAQAAMAVTGAGRGGWGGEVMVCVRACGFMW